MPGEIPPFENIFRLAEHINQNATVGDEAEVNTVNQDYYPLDEGCCVDYGKRVVYDNGEIDGTITVGNIVSSSVLHSNAATQHTETNLYDIAHSEERIFPTVIQNSATLIEPTVRQIHSETVNSEGSNRSPLHYAILILHIS